MSGSNLSSDKFTSENSTDTNDLSSEEKESNLIDDTTSSEMSQDISSPGWISSSRSKLTTPEMISTEIMITSPPPPTSTMTNLLHRAKSICMRFIRLLYGIFNAAVFMGILCSLFLAEIIVAVVYRDEIECSSSVMSIFNWLIFDAVVGVLWMITLISFVYLDMDLKENSRNVIVENYRHKHLRFVCQLLLIAISLLRGSWLIVGSVIFWRDCPTLKPKPVQDLMWAVLLISYIAIFLRLLQRNENVL